MRALERQDHTASVAKSPVYVIENSKQRHRLYASVAESQPIMPVLFWGKGVVTQWIGSLRTVWPSGLRRWLQAPVRKGVGSNPTAVMLTWGVLKARPVDVVLRQAYSPNSRSSATQ